MLRNKISLLLLFVVFLFSCSDEDNSKSELNDQIKKVSQTDNYMSKISIDHLGKYYGVLPCADCEGIETTITLDKAFKFTKITKYIGKDERSFKEEGRYEWDEEGNQIILIDISKETSAYFVGENYLVQLDMEGNRVTGELADKYILVKDNDNGKISSLLNTKWVLTELRGKSLQFKSANNKKIFLVLDSEKKIYGFAGCNNFNGTYELKENGIIEFSEKIAITRMACPDMELEQDFVKVLTQVDNYNHSEDKLILNNARMATLARFEAEQ